MDPLSQNLAPRGGSCVKEWIQQPCQRFKGDVLPICLAELWQEDIANLQGDTQRSCAIGEEFLQKLSYPAEVILLIVALL